MLYLSTKDFIKSLIKVNELAEKEWFSLSDEEQQDCTNSHFLDDFEQDLYKEIQMCKQRIEKNKKKFCTKFQLKKYIKHLGMENYYPNLFTKL